MKDIVSGRMLALREKHKLLQKDLAAVLAIRPNVYLRYEHGERSLPIDKLVLLADFYKTSADYILGRTNETVPYERIETK